ncbi:MAG: methyltransferase domain-containing protein [Candidatus Nanopelagicales bacterium]
MSIDQTRVKKFWDSRAEKYQELPFESVANLEQDPENLRLKIELETEAIAKYTGDVVGKTILDLGAGVGQWSFRFIENGANRVTAVEYSEGLAEIGRVEAEKRGVNSIEFFVSPAEQFVTDEQFDLVFISGLFVYLNDPQAQVLAEGLASFCSDNSKLVVRDGTGVPNRHEINQAHSEHLDSEYSAVYRTRDEYIDLMTSNGFKLVKDENVFYEGCPLNKYPETRLRVYEFVLDN